MSQQARGDSGVVKSGFNWKTSELSGGNSAYLESLYETYLKDPAQLSQRWQDYFKASEAPDTPETGSRHAQTTYSHEEVRAFLIQEKPWEREVSCSQSETGRSDGGPDVLKSVAVINLINAYRSLGHRKANLDPLELNKTSDIQAIQAIQGLDLNFYGLSSRDLESLFHIQTLGYQSPVRLKEILADLEKIYCQHIGFEYMHMTVLEEKNWLQARIEKLAKFSYSASWAPQIKKKLYQDLVAADGLEKYLGMKYAGQKRFSLEGGDTLIPMVNYLIYLASVKTEEKIEEKTEVENTSPVKEIVMGMAHRGRLNVLVNVLGKSPESLMAEFEGRHATHLLSGDVKYHNGFSSDLLISEAFGFQKNSVDNGNNRDDFGIHIALAFNPSHLEIVSPVVSGAARAKSDRRHQKDFSKVLPVLIHGDAAFAGQGVVMEHLNLSKLRGFQTGGSVHIVINNQVGFTTSNPKDARSSTYCTDVAKMIEAPIFHVNAEAPEAALWVIEQALAYRMKFKKDVVIDLVCYRLHGHNESDEPSGTQPLMYQAIKKHETAYKLYAAQLIRENILDAHQAEQYVLDYRARLEAGHSVVPQAKKTAVDKKLNFSPYMNTRWDVSFSHNIPLDQLKNIAKKLEYLPEGFILQKQVAKTLEDRAKMTAGELPVNWGYAEILAYATLIAEGYSLRLVGQDAGRGTFSHRHGVLHNQLDDSLYMPLQQVALSLGSNLDGSKAIVKTEIKVEIIDSLLSEEAVMAFEYGYAGAAPNSLVLWEAQFGDFANGAQVVIDQFISSGEEKWGRLCGLVLLLPHGQEGMGAEHSSARLERFMQLCAHDNIQICAPTTPAQIYHLLRRQMVRPYRKPLIIMSPKSLLRHPLVTSNLEALAFGEFECVIDEIEPEKLALKKLDRLVLCQGKVFYDLLTRRRDENIQNIALVRIEQLYPFPEDHMKCLFEKYKQIKEIVWCQEEPVNQGAWYTTQHAIRRCMQADQVLHYAGRAAFASPAVGYPALYKSQQEQLVRDALKI